MNEPIVFSSMQPSGNLTIGNYIGTLLNWIKLQKKNFCIYSIADLHAITIYKNIKNIYKKNLDTLATYLACGIDPYKNIIFLQSSIHQHNQLNWILNCHSYFGELNRMTQFKDKLKTYSLKKVNIGLFNYPILMASDILIFNANKVPIGEDQKQHLELTRNLARRFNILYGDIFNIPKSIIPKIGSRIMSLSDPRKKMSKSDSNKNNIIFLLDKKKDFIRKIKKSITDSDISKSIKYDLINKPGISNLIILLASIRNTSISLIEKEFYGKSYKNFKDCIIYYLSRFLISFQEKYYLFRSDENFLKKILISGSEKASLKADIMIKKIFNKINFF
ncbi:tryptophan--tRNA ligase [Sodalis-like secondary symbiont of Drepanosiphum platanoidis]|uniref:tryptophan--tRNA ligase n=1 Tax=Sodalis-like secondary symbiont of Drepanosiphum platanoidis TaxID=2994493 RepID=UPI0034638C04